MQANTLPHFYKSWLVLQYKCVLNPQQEIFSLSEMKLIPKFLQVWEPHKMSLKELYVQMRLIYGSLMLGETRCINK